MRRRSPNGESESWQLNIKFDAGNPDDVEAYELYREFAGTRSFKSLVVGYLLALKRIRDASGELPNPDNLLASFVRAVVLGHYSGISDTPTLMRSHDMPLDDLPSAFMGSAVEPDVSEARDNFSRSFLDDDDNDWDF